MISGADDGCDGSAYLYRSDTHCRASSDVAADRDRSIDQDAWFERVNIPVRHHEGIGRGTTQSLGLGPAARVRATPRSPPSLTLTITNPQQLRNIMPKEERTELDNVGARQAAIKNGYDQIFLLDAEIVKKTEQYLKELKEERTKTWRNLKADVNIPQKGSRSGLSPLQGGGAKRLRTPRTATPWTALSILSARCHPPSWPSWRNRRLGCCDQPR